MNKKPMTFGDRNGTTLIVVMALTLLGTLAASSVAFSTGSRVQRAYKQVYLEQAFYIAEAGAERAASYATVNESDTTLSGNLGQGSYQADVVCDSLTGGEFTIEVTSVGTVGGVSRTVMLHGLRRVSWARYALWYDQEVSKLWIVPGERFDGRVYSRPLMHFHDSNLGSKGQVHFYDKVWTGASTIEKASSSVNPIFDKGIVYNASVETMASVLFSDLLSDAGSGGLVLEGVTTISVSGSTMTITNSRKGWSNKAVALPANGMVYVKTSISGTTSTRIGDLTVSALNGLNGRLTLVAENDIKIINHVRYASNPQTNPTSDDALGLIAKRSVVVQTSAPNNLDVYAHIICTTGGFGVADYNTGSARGTLTVFGGLVNQIRNAVGTTGGTGYLKNYIFDKRFTKNPPPHYPVLTDELEWENWEG